MAAIARSSYDVLRSGKSFALSDDRGAFSVGRFMSVSLPTDWLAELSTTVGW